MKTLMDRNHLIAMSCPLICEHISYKSVVILIRKPDMSSTEQSLEQESDMKYDVHVYIETVNVWQV